MIPQDQVHPKLWEGANKKFRKLPRARLEKEKQERVSVLFVDRVWMTAHSGVAQDRRAEEGGQRASQGQGQQEEAKDQGCRYRL